MPIAQPLASSSSTTQMHSNIDNNIRCHPIAAPLNINPKNSLKDLAHTVKLVGLPLGWTVVESDHDLMKVIYIQERQKNPITDPMITKSITIYEDRTWVLRVHGKIVHQFDCDGLENPMKDKAITTTERFFEILTTVDEARICCGNPDLDLLTTMERKVMTI